MGSTYRRIVLRAESNSSEANVRKGEPMAARGEPMETQGNTCSQESRLSVAPARPLAPYDCAVALRRYSTGDSPLHCLKARMKLFSL
jgi:hypothetical protein